MEQLFPEWRSPCETLCVDDETFANFDGMGYSCEASSTEETSSSLDYWRLLQESKLFYQHDATEKENQEPTATMETPTKAKLLEILLQSVSTVHARMDAVEKRLSKEIQGIHALLTRFVDENVESRENSPPPTSASSLSHPLVNTPMREAIDAAKPLKYWGECLHFVLRRPDLFHEIIHWADAKGANYWISNEEALHAILALLKGSTPQRSRESMKSRFFVKAVNEYAQRKEGNRDTVFDLYENKKPDYTPTSLNYPRVATTAITTTSTSPHGTQRVKIERKRSHSSDEEDGGGKRRK